MENTDILIAIITSGVVFVICQRFHHARRDDNERSWTANVLIGSVIAGIAGIRQVVGHGLFCHKVKVVSSGSLSLKTRRICRGQTWPHTDG